MSALDILFRETPTVYRLVVETKRGVIASKLNYATLAQAVLVGERKGNVVYIKVERGERYELIPLADAAAKVAREGAK